MRAHIMKIHRKISRKRRTTRDILQFAPNFTTYVLSPNIVCLYSEDRKFFLHGELYCTIATAIGKSGKSAQALRRELGRQFPADKIDEAINRLIERRYVVQTSGASTGVVAAYWASIGLPPSEAEK